MSTADTSRSEVLPAGFALWRRQAGAIFGLELRKTFLRGGSLLILALCTLPIAILIIRTASQSMRDHVPSLTEDATMYANVFVLLLRCVVFFGCFAIFTHLFRGEVLHRTLHFYFLAPIRRPVLMVGKFIAGLAAAIPLFCGVAALGFVLAYLPSGVSGRQFLFDGAGPGVLIQYIAIAALACVGYGAVFLALGLFFRNPMLPAACILGWESINFLLPPLLKRISVVYWLDAMVPVPVSEGPLAFPSEPVSAWLAVLGLLAVAAVLLVLSARRVERFEVLYGED